MKMAKMVAPWKPMHIWFVGDIQWSGNPEAVATNHLKRTLQQALEDEQRGHEVRFILMGDYIDFLSPSNRSRLKSSNLYDTANDVIDQKAMSLTYEVAEMLAPIRGKVLGVVEGHHFHELKDGTTTDMRLCEMLEAPFFGTTGLIHIQFERVGTKSQGRIAATIWFAHGSGNGQTGYYPLMRLAKKAAEWEGVDVFAMGHTTKKCMDFQNKPYPRWANVPDLAHRKVILVGTGGYSKTYVLGAKQGQVERGGYAEQGMMNAAIIGSPVVHIRPFSTHGNYLGLEVAADPMAPLDEGLDITAEG